MLNEFIQKTLDILKESDLPLRFSEIVDVELKNGKRTFHYISECSSGGTRIEDNLIFNIIIFFTLIDTFIDIKHPALEGESFAGKYRKILGSDDFTIMVREIYRILKILRNASIHSKNAIQLKDKKIIIDYKFKSTHFKLEITKLCLELIYTFVFILIEENKYCEMYRTNLLRTFYDDIRGNISFINDDLGSINLEQISLSPRIKRGVRYRVRNPVFEVDKSNINIAIHQQKVKVSEEKERDYEYLIKIDENNYLIPNEILDNDGKIKLSELDKWKL